MNFAVLCYYLLLVAAIYPLHFLVTNLSDFSSEGAIIFGLAASLGLTMVLYVIFQCATKHRQFALLLTLLATLIFWNVRTLVEIPAYPVMLLLLISLWLLYRTTGRFLLARKAFIPVSVFLHVMVLLPIGIKAINSSGTITEAVKNPVAAVASTTHDKPDIYYIILDGYGRDDMLKSLYGYDNRSFINTLERMGFYVGRKSHSNYGKTVLSLASSLNMDYLEAFSEIAHSTGTDYREPSGKRIANSQARTILAKEGYQFIAVDSGYRLTTINNADTVLTPAAHELYNQQQTEFLIGMLHVSPLALIAAENNESLLEKIRMLLYRYLPESDRHPAMMLFRFNALRHMAPQTHPKFVFAHILCPHPPFVFEPNDSFTHYNFSSPIGSYTLNDGYSGINNPLRVQNYLHGYVNQLQYVNRQMEDILPRIIASNPNSIIILQGDHGPGAYLNWESAEDSNLFERFSILNAYYFPDKNYAKLYPTISPVNSFRIIFSQYFGQDYPLLPDRSYFIPFQGIAADIGKSLEISDKLDESPKND